MKPLDNAGTTSLPMNSSPHRLTRFLARQPILDVHQKIVAYELLFRSGWDNVYAGEDDDSTRQILDNILVVGAQGLSSNTLAFVNCTRAALVGHLVTLLPPAYTVLEVLESIEPDQQVITSCRELKKMGYRLALDDFSDRPNMAPLVELADYIKVDFRASGEKARRAIRSNIRHCHAALLAEKIEQQAEFAVAVDEGYDLFQGYFFSRPVILAREEVPLNRINAAGLLAAVAKPVLDQKEIERLVMADAPLCFRLLRLANSPLYGVRDRVDSVRRALITVGEDEFRKLVTVAVAGALSKDRPHALICLSLQRARFCELLAFHLKEDPFEQYLMGLLSLLDAILQAPMTSIVDLLPLRPAARSALLGESNSTGRALCFVKGYETGDLCSANSAELIALGPTVLNDICAQAGDWAETALRSTGS
ncbi:putative signal transduction protein [Acidisarcina polymorpha]|uniref:Putative signal transduction protein n=1 Tax=Acidisarcina polymorpha TaxID=2211140 RepID=A0A2Z5FW94_9BACT|nr:HDOD domain-containing protein [Acidisarcina polymorpha]AXC10655.1 putative signal transduction protein [Acidisarcina polymorpha]